MNTERRYSERFVTSIFGSNIWIHELPSDLANILFCELTRQKEFEIPESDQCKKWELWLQEQNKPLPIRSPFLDVKIRSWVEKLEPGIANKRALSRWPKGKRFALCLTHDVDFVTRIRVSLGDCIESISRIYRAPSENASLISPAFRMGLKFLWANTVWAANRRDKYWHNEDWLELENSFGYKSTFFFLAGKLPMPHSLDTCYVHNSKVIFNKRRMTTQDMIIDIDRSGWDVGLHGSYHSAENLDCLKEEKNLLEKSLGHSIISIRQHYLHYNIKLTPRIQAAAGFRVDTTQGFTNSIGYRAGTSFPYYCWDHAENRPLDLLEIPLHAMDSALFSKIGQASDKKAALGHVTRLMDQVADLGGCLVLNWHSNWRYNSDYWDTYKQLLEEGKRRDAWGCSVRELYDWWTRSEKPCMR